MRKLHFIVILLFSIPLIDNVIVFIKTFGGEEAEFAYSIQQTKDGGYIVAGSTDSYGHGSYRSGDWWIIKLDKDGIEEWNKTFGESEKDGAKSIRQTIDGGYIAAGWMGQDMVIIKLDANGDSSWTKTYKGKTVSVANCIRQTTDGGYIVTGFGEDNVLKLDSDGNREWGKHFGWIFYSIQQTTDNGYIVAGDSIYQQLEFTYIPSLTLFKLDENGNKEWSNPLGNQFLGKALSVQQTTDSGYIVAGDSVDLKSEFNYSTYSMVMKLDGNGNREWSYFGDEFSEAASIRQTSDGGYIVAGAANRNEVDLWIIKLDGNGNEEWNKIYGSSGWEYASSIEQTTDGGYIVAGQTDFYGVGKPKYNMWILKLDENGNADGNTAISHSKNESISGFSLSQNYPNPFNSSTIICFDVTKLSFVTLKIYNLLGQEIETLINRRLSPGVYKVKWTGKGLTSGIYFYHFEAGKFRETKKLILQK